LEENKYLKKYIILSLYKIQEKKEGWHFCQPPLAIYAEMKYPDI